MYSVMVHNCLYCYLNIEFNSSVLRTIKERLLFKNKAKQNKIEKLIDECILRNWEIFTSQKFRVE